MIQGTPSGKELLLEAKARVNANTFSMYSFRGYVSMRARNRRNSGGLGVPAARDSLRTTVMSDVAKKKHKQNTTITTILLCSACALLLYYVNMSSSKKRSRCAISALSRSSRARLCIKSKRHGQNRACLLTGDKQCCSGEARPSILHTHDLDGPRRGRVEGAWSSARHRGTRLMLFNQQLHLRSAFPLLTAMVSDANHVSSACLDDADEMGDSD